MPNEIKVICPVCGGDIREVEVPVYEKYHNISLTYINSGMKTPPKEIESTIGYVKLRACENCKLTFLPRRRS